MKKTTDDENVDENVETKKRGRKAKKQIIEFNNNNTTGTVTCDSEGNKSSSDQLEELLNEMLETPEEEKEGLKEVNESDLDAVLRELEDGELEEENMVVPPPTKKAEKTGGKGKNKKDKKEEEEPKEEEEEEKKVTTTTNKKDKKKVKISQ